MDKIKWSISKYLGRNTTFQTSVGYIYTQCSGDSR